MNRQTCQLIVAASIGAVVFTIIGFIVYVLPRGADGGQHFWTWLAKPLYYHVLWWPLLGGLVGAGAKFCASRQD